FVLLLLSFDLLLYSFFPSILRCPPLSTLFPYTTLFRSTQNNSRRGSSSALTPLYPIDPEREYLRSNFPIADNSPTGPSRSGLLRSEEHMSELQSRGHLVCRLLLEKKKKKQHLTHTFITT